MVPAEPEAFELETNEAERAEIRRQLLAEFPAVLASQRELNERRLSGDLRGAKPLLQKITDYEERLIKFTAGEDREAAAAFWQVIEKLSGPEYAAGFRRGIVAQVAVLKTLKAAGHEAVVASAAQNMTKIDIVLDKEIPLQVKGRREGRQPFIFKCDAVTLPVIEIQKQGVSHWFSAKDERDMHNFSAKVESLSRALGKEIVGYLVYIPEKFFDRDTGEPTPKLIEAFKQHLAVLSETGQSRYNSTHAQ